MKDQKFIAGLERFFRITCKEQPLKDLNRVKGEVIGLIEKGQLLSAARMLAEFFRQKDLALYRTAIIVSMEVYTLEEAVVGGRLAWDQENETRCRLANKMMKMIYPNIA
ncbi:MAG: hypothetical protein HRU41_22580 [Saprospiraceae bacterium]|nr:hypothetical protein [Saprospiraceae bacterium]